LSSEEVLVGIEFGFLNLNILKYNYDIETNFLHLKFIFKNIKNMKKIIKKQKQNTNFTETKCEIIIRLWRESNLLISSIFEKIDNKFKKNKQNYLNMVNKKKILINVINRIKQKNFVNFKIFRDLWQRGLIVTCGIKFGALYITYAGEFSIVHASCSIIVLEKNDNIFPHDLICFGRIGTSIQKRCLLAFINTKFLVNYIGLKWNSDLP
jgi:tRNA splicing endonuclease